jgi:O-antigen/teichoic acid export membrane protein
MLRYIFRDALYRNSLVLLVNTVATSAIGFGFWALAAHNYPAATVGAFSGVTAGVTLLATVAQLGLPTMVTRHIASAQNSRELAVASVTAIATVGTILCLVTVLVLGPHLPAALDLRARGKMLFFVTGLVGVTAVSGTIDASLVATRASHAVLIKNLVGNLFKTAALILLTSLRSSGLLISYGLGLVLSTALSVVPLFRRTGGKRLELNSFRALRPYLSITSGNYLATIMGILPTSVVPLEVLIIRGAADTARFTIAFLVAGLINFIPSTVAQVLFAEASRQGVTLGKQLRKAIRGIYGLLLPALAIVVATAPYVLRLFGTAYATAATGCLRVLALSAVLTGGTYLVDSLLIARDRTAAYVFMNGANAALVLACVAVLLPRGLTAAAEGWALAQGLSLLLGLVVLATAKSGRHRQIPADLSDRTLSQHSHLDLRPGRVIYAFEPQIRELLATWPMMPTASIAERIGWDQSIRILLDRVTELRREYSHFSRHHISSRVYRPGEIVQCGFWFPPVELPVGFGQTRSARQLPVLTMISGYSRWLSAVLIPSRSAGDLFAGLWTLIEELGSVPQVMAWDNEGAVGSQRSGRTVVTDECRNFCRELGSRVIIGTSASPETRDLIERAHAHMERSFLINRTFTSPTDFNNRLRDWLTVANTRPRQRPSYSPAELIDSDMGAMLPLPRVAPATGWQVSTHVEKRPFVHFDSNDYSVHPGMIGRRVVLIADLSYIRVLHAGKVGAHHRRAWARNLTISDPSHLTSASMVRPTRTKRSGDHLLTGPDVCRVDKSRPDC